MKKLIINIEVVSAYSIKYLAKKEVIKYTGPWWKKLFHIGSKIKTTISRSTVTDMPEDTVYVITLKSKSNLSKQTNSLKLSKNNPISLTYDLDLFKGKDNEDVEFSISLNPSCRVFSKIPVGIDKKNHTLCLNIKVLNEDGQIIKEYTESVFKNIGCNLTSNSIEYAILTAEQGKYSRHIITV